MIMHRRRFLHLSAAAAGAALASSRVGFDTADAWGQPLGVQLYTVRNQLPKAAEQTLRAIADVGYTEVEIGRADLGHLRLLLKKVGLKPVSMHIEAPVVTGNWSAWKSAGVRAPEIYGIKEAIEDARLNGITHLVVAYLMPSERGDLNAWKRFLEQMSEAGEICRQAGITLAYHNHAFEFERIDGQRRFDLMVQQLDPARVQIELDVFWAAVAGEDPAALIRSLRGRVPLLHLKDKREGAPTGVFTEGIPPESFAEVGSGTIDFTAVIRAAGEAGVRHYFVEQDHTPGEPVDSLRKSYTYLRGLEV